jgi:uncharacterized protein (DUF427 family)
MGLMTGTGPLGRKPAGTFNFEPPAPGRALYVEPSPKRIRVEVAGEIIADSLRAMMLHESGQQPIYYFPPDDVRADVIEPSDRHTHCPKKGDASYYTIRVGDHVIESGAWYYPEPIEGAPPIKDLIDVLHSDRHVRVSLDGELLADTHRALALFESNLPSRWYLPREDVVAGLEPSDTITRCPYKGNASYHSVTLSGGKTATDLVWTYADPLPEVGRITGLLCFFNEKVDIELDGVLQQRPDSPWSHGVKSQAPTQNAPPALTRG